MLAVAKEKNYVTVAHLDKFGFGNVFVFAIAITTKPCMKKHFSLAIVG